MPESTMIERVARAMWGIAGNENAEDGWRELIPVARTLIAVMREPTRTMLDAGMLQEMRGDVRTGRYNSVIWPAMIDAALADE